MAMFAVALVRDDKGLVEGDNGGMQRSDQIWRLCWDSSCVDYISLLEKLRKEDEK